jgi:hypothetical protein
MVATDYEPNQTGGGERGPPPAHSRSRLELLWRLPVAVVRCPGPDRRPPPPLLHGTGTEIASRSLPLAAPR